MKQAADVLIGEFLLLDAGEQINNPKYVSVYGRYTRLLRELPYRTLSADRRKELTALYSREAESAKFWATYPEDVSKISAKHKRAIFIREFLQRGFGG